jgi:hypothetical protein
MCAMVQALHYVDSKGIDGDVVECGVWHGGNIMLARFLSPKRTCWLYDTFTGMPPPGPLDTKRSGNPARDSFVGKLAVSRETVIANLREQDCWDDDRIRLVPGRVEDTLQYSVPNQIAVLHLDTDWYESTKIELEVLYPRLSPGGILIVDDYGHWAGARKAVDDYFRKARPRFTSVDYTAVMCVKPAQI